MRGEVGELLLRGVSEVVREYGRVQAGGSRGEVGWRSESRENTEHGGGNG